jgi:hypothetical protein
MEGCRLGIVAFGVGLAILNNQFSAQPHELHVLTQSPLGAAAIRVEFFMGAMLLGILLRNLFGYVPPFPAVRHQCTCCTHCWQ